MNNDEIFEDFWKNYTWPEVKPVFFRLYYDESGAPLAYSMEDLPGQYIEITAEQFAESSGQVVVKNGQLIKKSQNRSSKLTPAETGVQCHPEDVTIVVDTVPNQKWKLKIYDNN